ncbi:hypothetical protein ZOSMA_53G00020 [Zostera marina]|uniref:Uncharacterized protein n=1 Tax=Zostera marina TaxID=29655 RepID=A0A0K9NZ18_ZOSMR|nr:hypothetical protein ZOSMA_53G00020 [Zostera marina]
MTRQTRSYFLLPQSLLPKPATEEDARRKERVRTGMGSEEDLEMMETQRREHAEVRKNAMNCVILGGTQMEKKIPNPASTPESPAPAGTSTEAEDNSSIPESFYTNGGLKLRIVWTISLLIAASTRHYLLRPIIKDYPTLCSLVLTDADDQGTLTMGKEQLREFREKPLATSASSSRT